LNLVFGFPTDCCFVIRSVTAPSPHPESAKSELLKELISEVGSGPKLIDLPDGREPKVYYVVSSWPGIRDGACLSFQRTSGRSHPVVRMNVAVNCWE
jgi:hypothetical protein